VPFLDPEVARLAWSMPLDQKISSSQGKLVLRRLVDRYVPRALMDRPKQGFQIPIADWLRSDLRDWAEDLLSEERIRRDGVLCPEPIRKAWSEHLSGRYNRDTRLWTVLMFQSWFKEQQMGDV
jgi:asparagine synthase (glutamine-hydrolysing)